MLVNRFVRGVMFIKMNEFKNYHPSVNFIYFVIVISFSVIFMNPVCLMISFISGFAYSIMLNGKKALKFNLMYILPFMIISAVINTAFNHEGVTVLKYLPSGNPLTLESVIYGIAAASMLAAVMCHFSCFNKIMTSDKFVYLFGKIIPSMSLILSMILRFVPRFKIQLKEISSAQKCVGRDVSEGNIIQRAKNGIKILSVMITLSLENSIETADSMKSRGYGLPGRTAYSNFVFDKRDAGALIFILFTAAYVIMGACMGTVYFKYFPSFKSAPKTLYGITVFIAYTLLFFSPIIIELMEAFRWKKSRSKI